MPETFLRMKNGRIAYQLMSWTMKQFNLARDNIFKKIRYGTAKEKAIAVKDLGRAIAYVGSANLTADEAKRWVTGRDSNFANLRDDQWANQVAYKLLAHSFKNYLGSENPFTEITFPTADIVTRLGQDYVTYGKDIAETKSLNVHGDAFKEARRETVSKIPIFGKIYAYWYLDGANKFNEREKIEGHQYQF
jgi:hypothetical protein